jgi:hypothetical protein
VHQLVLQDDVLGVFEGLGLSTHTNVVGFLNAENVPGSVRRLRSERRSRSHPFRAARTSCHQSYEAPIEYRYWLVAAMSEHSGAKVHQATRGR